MTPEHPATIAQELRATLRLALPLIAGQLASFGTTVADVMLAGHLGADVLGAVAVGTNVWMLALMALVGLTMAVPPTVAQLDGAGRRGEVAGEFRQAVWLMLPVGIALQQAVWHLGPRLPPLLGVDAALMPDITAFLRPLSLTAPALGVWLVCRGVTDGLGMTRVSLGFGVLGLVLLVPVAWALMYGRAGLPALGAAGLGWATALANWVCAALYLAYLRFSPRLRGIGWQHGGWRPDSRAILHLLRLGLPMAVSVLLEVGLFSAVGLVIGGFGAVAVAAHLIALKACGLTFMLPLGRPRATTVRVGLGVGRGDWAGMRRAGLVGIAIPLVTQSLSCAVMLGLPGPITRLYTDDPQVIAGAASLLALAALFQLSDGIQVASAGALRGLKDTRVPMLVTAFAYWVAGMPVGWFLAFPQGLGPRGMWMGLIAGLTAAAVLLSARFLRLSAGYAAARSMRSRSR